MKARRKILPDDEPLREVRTVMERFRELFKPECQARGCTSEAEKDEMFCAYHRLVDAF